MSARTLGPGPWCGTPGGYVNHKCRCLACTESNTKAVAARREIRYAQRVPQGPVLVHPKLRRHGTVTGYQYWGCRCALCSEASSNSRKRGPAKREKRTAEVSYVTGPTGWNVLLKGEVVGRVAVESFNTGRWGAWRVLEGGTRGEQLVSGLPRTSGRDGAAQALLDALRAKGELP